MNPNRMYSTLQRRHRKAKPPAPSESKFKTLLQLFTREAKTDKKVQLKHSYTQFKINSVQK